MNDLARQLFGDDVPAKRLALIVDLDETVCTGFACPLRAALDVLSRLHRQKVEVHYVTARTEVSRKGTDDFLAEHRLPGHRNVYYCPKREICLYTSGGEFSPGICSLALCLHSYRSD